MLTNMFLFWLNIVFQIKLDIYEVHICVNKTLLPNLLLEKEFFYWFSVKITMVMWLTTKLNCTKDKKNKWNCFFLHIPVVDAS